MMTGERLDENVVFTRLIIELNEFYLIAMPSGECSQKLTIFEGFSRIKMRVSPGIINLTTYLKKIRLPLKK